MKTCIIIVRGLEKKQRAETNESSALLLLPIGCNDRSKDGHLDKLMFCHW